MNLRRTNNKSRDRRTVDVYRNMNLHFLMVIVMLSLSVQAVAIETDLNVKLEIDPQLKQSLVLKKSDIKKHYKYINNKQIYVTELFNELDVAFTFDDKRRLQNILRVLFLTLEELQENFAAQDIRLEQYRLFLYRLLASSIRKQPDDSEQPVNSQWQALAKPIFEEMLSVDKVVIGSSIKSILDLKEELSRLYQITSHIPKSPYENVAGLLNEHDSTVLERIHVNIKKGNCVRLKSVITGIVDLYINKELGAEEFIRNDYRDLRDSIGDILIDFSEEVEVENPYSPSESKVVQ